MRRRQRGASECFTASRVRSPLTRFSNFPCIAVPDFERRLRSARVVHQHAGLARLRCAVPCQICSIVCVSRSGPGLRILLLRSLCPFGHNAHPIFVCMFLFLRVSLFHCIVAFGWPAGNCPSGYQGSAELRCFDVNEVCVGVRVLGSFACRCLLHLVPRVTCLLSSFFPVGVCSLAPVSQSECRLGSLRAQCLPFVSCVARTVPVEQRRLR